MEDYHINISYNSKDELYVADIPDLKNCSALGLSPIMALYEVLLAKDLWIKKAKEEGREIPEPKYKALSYEMN
jgi:predicted RNase H-like HicB family nuclease